MTNIPSSARAAHRAFLERIVPLVAEDDRFVGIAAGGSFLTNLMDDYSDLDFVLVVDPQDYDAVMRDRASIAASFGTLVAGFTGEHVGEPRLLICLYDDPVLHVDLKFLKPDDLARRVEDPAVLWERAGIVTSALQQGHAVYPPVDPQWIEDRFWVWVHYAATKIERRELFEVIDFLSAIRSMVLVPLAMRQAGLKATGVRKVERSLPEFAARLEATLCVHDAADCKRAVQACIDLYRELRASAGNVAANPVAERVSVNYLEAVATSDAPTSSHYEMKHE